MKIALVQQHATEDKRSNLQRGIVAAKAAIEAGANVVCFAELAFEPFYPQQVGFLGCECIAPHSHIGPNFFQKFTAHYTLLVQMNRHI